MNAEQTTGTRRRSGKAGPALSSILRADPGLSATDLRAVRELKTRLLKEVPLHRLIVFGSRARGDADPESDLDVLVELNHADLRARKLVTEGAWEVSLRNNMVIMPVTVDRREWETGAHKSSLLARAIAMEGVEV